MNNLRKCLREWTAIRKEREALRNTLFRATIRLAGPAAILSVMSQGVAAQDIGAELVEALQTKCLPLVTDGVVETAGLSEVPSFIAANFFELLEVEGKMYQLSPAGDARIVVPEEGGKCVAYVQTDTPEDVFRQLDEWRAEAGFEGALPDRTAGEAEGILRSETASIAVRLDEDRHYLILTMTAGG